MSKTKTIIDKRDLREFVAARIRERGYGAISETARGIGVSESVMSRALSVDEPDRYSKTLLLAAKYITGSKNANTQYLFTTNGRSENDQEKP